MWILQKRSKIEKDSGRPEDESSRRDERGKLDFRFLSLVMGRCIRYMPRFHRLFNLKNQKPVRNKNRPGRTMSSDWSGFCIFVKLSDPAPEGLYETGM